MVDDDAVVSVAGLAKTFTLHNLNSAIIPVFDDLALDIRRGECVILAGPSGIGKSTLLRAIYGNYRVSAGEVRVRHDGEMVDLATADPRTVIAVRRRTLGYVGQFLRVIPRIAAIDIVMEPLLTNGWSNDMASTRARDLLARLNVPEPLWTLPPATFSGGEQQRVNVARGFAHNYPILLLDEPTASLDATNASVVATMIEEALSDGSAVLGIFHDADMRARLATRDFPIGAFVPQARRESIPA
ncbi:MAG: phosphonate C-P lyase system protein PhnL [Sphingobium limneticum]